MRQDVAGIILAGGRSSRMGGGDKCLLPLGPDVVLDHVVRRLAPQVAALAKGSVGADKGGYRKELLELIDVAAKTRRP